MPKLLEQVRTVIRTRHYSLRTEQTYVQWIKQYIIFNSKRHPSDLGAAEVSAFLSYLAVSRKVAASTQNQALAAILFLYRHVLKQELPWLQDVERAKRPTRVPLVFTRQEVRAVLSHLSHTTWLMASLLYGSGLRLNECLSLRVKDLDFEYCQIVVREAVDRQAKCAFRIDVESASGAVDGDPRVLCGVGAPAIEHTQDVPLGKPGMGLCGMGSPAQGFLDQLT